MVSTTTLIPRLFRNIGIAKTNGASILKTEVGSIIDFRSIRSINNNLFIKEYPEYVCFEINTDYFTVNSLTASYATFGNITSSIGRFTHLTGSRISSSFITGSNISGSQATFTRLTGSFSSGIRAFYSQITGSDTLTTFLTSSYAKLTQITGSHQKLIDGTNAFVAGPGIKIQNHFGGAVGISSSMEFTSVKTTTYQSDFGNVVLADISAGGFTVSMPDTSVGSCVNKEVIVKITSIAAGNSLTVEGYYPQTIDTMDTITLSTDYASVWLKCDGTNWWRLS